MIKVDTVCCHPRRRRKLDGKCLDSHKFNLKSNFEIITDASPSTCKLQFFKQLHKQNWHRKKYRHICLIDGVAEQRADMYGRQFISVIESSFVALSQQ